MFKIPIDRDSIRNLPSEEINILLQEHTSHLKSRGHRNGTVRSYLNSATHFEENLFATVAVLNHLQWLTQRSSSQIVITSEAVHKFLYQHLPACSCPQPTPKSLKSVQAELNLLLFMRGQDRFHMPTPSASGDIEVSIHQFDDYMGDACGLARETRISRAGLSASFSAPSLALNQWILTQSQQSLYSSILQCGLSIIDQELWGVLACTLSCYLHFLQFNGTVSSYLGDITPTPVKRKTFKIWTYMDTPSKSRINQ
jgi:hypothetical protein